jgi:hypothetical protein
MKRRPNYKTQDSINEDPTHFEFTFWIESAICAGVESKLNFFNFSYLFAICTHWFLTVVSQVNSLRTGGDFCHQGIHQLFKIIEYSDISLSIYPFGEYIFWIFLKKTQSLTS